MIAQMRPAANVTMLYADRPLSERLVAAAADGFAGVEILFPYDVDLDEVARLLGRHDLQHVLVNTPLGPEGEPGLAAVVGREGEFRRGFEQALSVTATTGCRSIHTMAGRPSANSSSAWMDTLLTNLRWAATRAGDAGVTVTLEALNHHDVPGYAYAQPSQALAVVQAVDHPAVRLQFDLYHSAREGLDLVAELDRARPFIHHVQIAGTPDRHEPDPADTALFASVRHLVASGYEGWLGFEYHPRGDTSAGLAWRAALPPLTP